MTVKNVRLALMSAKASFCINFWARSHLDKGTRTCDFRDFGKIFETDCFIDPVLRLKPTWDQKTHKSRQTTYIFDNGHNNRFFLPDELINKEVESCTTVP